MSQTLRPHSATVAEAPRRRGRVARMRRRLVRIVGRVPFQGRWTTLALIRVCHDASDAAARAAAARRLRRAALMNVVRHGLPVPVGAVAAVGFARLDAYRHTATWTGATFATGFLAAVGAIVFCSQASVHVDLARGLRDAARRTAAPQESGAGTGRAVPLTGRGTPAVHARDRAFTSVVVGLAMVLAPTGSAVVVGDLLDGPDGPVVRVVADLPVP